MGSTSAPSLVDDTQATLQYAASLLSSWAKIKARVKNYRNYHEYSWIICTKMFLLKLEKIGVRDSQRRSEVAGIDRLQVLNSLVWTHSFAWWKAWKFSNRRLPVDGNNDGTILGTMPYAIHSAICHHLPSILTMIPLSKDSWVTHQPPAKTSSRFVSERRWMAWQRYEIYEEIR